MTNSSARQQLNAHKPAGGVAALVPQLRVIIVAHDPSNAETNQRLRSLALHLRSQGHALLAAVPVGSLQPEDATAGDAAGLEYVFAIPRWTVRPGDVSGWKLLLHRFRPNVIHICADVPLSVAWMLARATNRTVGARSAVILEMPTSHDSPPASGSHGRAIRGGRLQKYATQVLCIGSRIGAPQGDTSNLGRERVTALVPMSAMEETQRRAPTLAIISDARSERSAVAALQALGPLLLAQESLRVVVGINKARMRYAELDQWPGDVRPRIVVAASFDEWLRHAADAVGAMVSPVGPLPLREIGAILALGLPLIAADDVVAGLGDAPLASILPIRWDHPTTLIHAVNELINDTGGVIRLDQGDPDQAAQRLLSMYTGVWLREHSSADALLGV